MKELREAIDELVNLFRTIIRFCLLTFLITATSCLALDQYIKESRNNIPCQRTGASKGYTNISTFSNAGNGYPSKCIGTRIDGEEIFFRSR
jgi:hypothetical protein